ncbi:MAG: hypothetical protein GY930_21545 [bacterium]|nr:hypothetical protein [bacterium]
MRFKLLLGLLGVLLLALWQWGAIASYGSTEADGLELRPEGAGQETLVLAEGDEAIAGQKIEGAAQRTHRFDASLSPDTIWVEGKVTYPLGFTPAADTRVWGQGANWPDGGKWYGAKVSASGTFRMAFAPGTERGHLELQDPNCWMRTGSYRVWQKGPIELDSIEGYPRKIRVVGEGVDTDSLSYSLSLTRTRYMPLIAVDEHQYRFAIGKGRWLIVKADGVGFPVLPITLHGSSSPEAVDNRLVIGKSARIVARVQAKGGAPLEYPWIEAFMVDEFPLADMALHKQRCILEIGAKGPSLMLVPGSEGTFDFEVPPNTSVGLIAHGVGASSLFVGVDPLEVGQVIHLPDIELPATSLVLNGQLVDTQGHGIANAWIRAGEDWNGHGTYLLDPGRCSQHLAKTDGDGRFKMRRGYESIESIYAFVGGASQRELGSPIDLDASAQIQGFGVKSPGAELQTFVFNPAPHGLVGSVKGGSGESFASVTIECLLFRPDFLAYAINANMPEEMTPSAYFPEASNEHLNPFIKGFDPSFQTTVATVNDRFQWESLPAGKWRVTIGAPGYVPVALEMVEVPNEEALNVILHPTGSVRALVKGYDGKPRAGAEVVLRSLNRSKFDFLLGSNYQSPGRTGEDGIVLLKDVEPGKYSAQYRLRGAKASASADVEVFPGKETEVVLQPKALGSVVLISPWPDSPLGLSAHLRNTETDITYPVAGRAFNEPLFKRDLPPGTYRLSISPSGIPKGAKARMESPLVEVQAGIETSVDLNLLPGFQYVSGRVYVNGEPAGVGSVVVSYPGGSFKLEILKFRDGGFFNAILPEYNPNQIIVMTRSARSRVSEWSLPIEGQEWRLDVGCVDVTIELVDPAGQLVDLSKYKRSIGLLENDYGGAAVGKYIDFEGVFSCVPDGIYKLKLTRAQSSFPWLLANPVEFKVEQGVAPQGLQAVLIPAHPVKGEIIPVDWPRRQSATLMAWSDSEATSQAGTSQVYLRQQSRFHLYGPKPGPFWLTVEPSRHKHHAGARILGPFQMTDEGLSGIEIKAYAVTD